METFYPPHPQPPPSRWPIGIGFAVIALAGAAGWWWYQRAVETTDPPEAQAISNSDEEAPLFNEKEDEYPVEEPVETEVVETPPSPRVPPTVNEWMGAPSFLQRLAAAVWRVSKGRSPAKVLGFVELEGPFSVTRKGRNLYIDPSSFQRYTPIVDSILALPPDQAAEIYKNMRPQLQARFAQLSNDEHFDQVAKRAIRRILRARIPRLPIEIVEVGGTYYYADDDIQALNDVTKHLIRLGPNNIKRLRKWLRSFSRQANLR